MNTELHPSIVALVSLASKIAANHPGQGLCQIDGLRQYSVSDEQDIGTEMRHAASRLAVSVRNAEVNGDLRPAMTDLSKVSRQCVACHAAQRIH